MKEYENLIILDPAVGEEGITNKIEHFKKFIEEGKGKCLNIDKWGIKTLAYPIKKKGEGYYVLFNLDAEPNLLTELNRELRLTKEVLRYCIMKKEEKKKKKEEKKNG